MPADRYHFAYADDSPYGHAVRLLADHTFVPDGVVVDVGCGYGAIAEPLRDLRLGYIGIDVEPAGVADVCHRGFEGAVVDLADPSRLVPRVTELLAGRPLAALCALDVLEHLTNGPAVLAALRDLAIAQGRVALVVSIPNVAHRDLAAKLVVGRWDVTPTGLLDETHVSLYAPSRLDAAFEAAGWAEVGEADFELVESDQHFPADAPVLAPTPLGDLLAGVRRRAAPGATTNQFVRAYVPVAIPPPHDVADPVPPPFLSVLLVDGGHDERVLDALVALDAQDLPGGEVDGGPAGLEVLVCTLDATAARRRTLEALAAPFTRRLAARTRVVAVAGAGRASLLDVAVRAARGRYVTVLDDGDLPFAHWLDTFARLADGRPGAVLRSIALSQPRTAVTWPGDRPGYEPAAEAEVASAARFDLAAHVAFGGSPPGSYAVPRSYFTVLGGAFTGTVPGLADDEVLARAAQACGVAEDTTTAVLLRRPAGAAEADETDDRGALLASLDAEPLLLPAGALGRLVAAERDRRVAEPREERPREPQEEPVTGPAVEPAGTPDAPAEAAARAQAEAEAEAAEAKRAEAEAGRAAAEAALAAARSELAAARSELAAARAELAEVRASTSWRVTAPLRRLGERRPH